MKSLHPYCAEILQRLKDKYSWENAFIQAVNEVFDSIGVIVEKEPLYRHERILERIVEPERTFTLGRTQMSRLAISVLAPEKSVFYSASTSG